MQGEHLDKLNNAIFNALNEGNPVNEIADAAYHLGFTAKPCKFVQRIIVVYMYKVLYTYI